MTNAVNIAGLGGALTVTSGVVNFSSTPTVNSSPIGASAATPTARGTVFGLMDDGSAGITATGWSAGAGLTSGANNVFNGFRAGYTTSSGTFHTFVGPEAGYGQTTGQRSVAVGYKALYATSTSSYNVAVGSEALTSNTGSSNTAVGYLAGTNVTSGANNTYIGTEAGGTHATADGCTYVGYKTRSSTSSVGNEFVFGFNCAGNGGASATIGDAVGQIFVQYRGSATWNQVSDIRLKKNITPDTLGLSFIQRLNPVKYQWKASNELDEDNPYYAEENVRDTEDVMHGLIAQEVKEALDAEGVTTFDGWKTAQNGMQAISHTMFVMPLIKAVQELKALNDTLTARITALEAR